MRRVSAFRLAWHSLPGPLPPAWRVRLSGAAGDPPLRLAAPATLVAAGLRLELDPAQGALRVDPESGAAAPWHYWRRADAVLRPLPPEPLSLTLAAGDAYVAVTAGARRLTDAPAAARFIHVRDDFTAGQLAPALLQHLLAEAGLSEPPEAVTAVVVEAV